MKNILIYSLAAIAVILLSLFMPYESRNVYTGSLLQNGAYRYVNLKTVGFEQIGAYIPIATLVLCIGIIKIKENLATAIISMILSFLNLFYMALLGVILTLNLSFFGGGPRNLQLQGGYYLSVLAGIYFFTIMISHLVVVVRKRRNPEKYDLKPVSSELLDDVI